MSRQYLSAGFGGEFTPNQHISSVHHPEPVSPSDVVDINHPNKYVFESHHLPRPEHQDFAFPGNHQKMPSEPHVPVDVLLRQRQQVLGGTKPEDKLTSMMMMHQRIDHFSTENRDESMKPMPTGHCGQAFFPSAAESHTPQHEKPNAINPSQSRRVVDSPASPLMQPKTESFGIQERQEKEEIDYALRMGKKKPQKATVEKVFFSPHDEVLTKIKRKKGKDACSQNEFSDGVLLPRPTPPRDHPLVTQPLQVSEAVFPEHSLALQNYAGYEILQDCHQHLYLSRNTCRITDQEFLETSKQLLENSQDGLWIACHDLHPQGGHYMEGHQFTAERFTKGGFGLISRCQDMVSMKKFVQKLMPKEKWRKEENISLLTLKNHPNICKLLGMKQESGKDGITVSLFLEDAGMSLSNYVRMRQPDKLTHQEIWDITEQMFRGLVYLHDHGILHLDLKPDNICIQGSPENITIKIIDFGSSKLPHEPIYFCGMTPEYLAPEVCKCFIDQQNGIMNLAEALITGKADVAAAALILLYMIEGYDVLIKLFNNGQTSYAGKTAEQIKSSRTLLIVLHACNPNLASQLINDHIDMNLRELLDGCLEGDPQKRFSSQQALDFIEERKTRAENPQLMPSMEQLEANLADKFGETPSKVHFRVRYQSQQGKGGLETLQQSTQLGARIFGQNSQQDSHGTNIFSAKFSNRYKHRDKTEPYPTHRRSICAVSEDLYTNGTNTHRNATGVIPTTVNPEAYPTASDGHAGNLPNLDLL